MGQTQKKEDNIADVRDVRLSAERKSAENV